MYPEIEYYKSWEEVPEDMYQEFEFSKYWALRVIPGQGLCALQEELFTIALLCKIGPSGYQGRYTFQTLLQGCKAICTWSGEGRPGDDWINYYGGQEGRVRNLQHPINKGHIFND